MIRQHAIVRFQVFRVGRLQPGDNLCMKFLPLRVGQAFVSHLAHHDVLELVRDGGFRGHCLRDVRV